MTVIAPGAPAADGIPLRDEVDRDHDAMVVGRGWARRAACPRWATTAGFCSVLVFRRGTCPSAPEEEGITRSVRRSARLVRPPHLPLHRGDEPGAVASDGLALEDADAVGVGDDFEHVAGAVFGVDLARAQCSLDEDGASPLASGLPTLSTGDAVSQAWRPGSFWCFPTHLSMSSRPEQ